MRAFILKTLICASVAGAWVGIVCHEFSPALSRSSRPSTKKEEPVRPITDIAKPWSGFGNSPRSLVPEGEDVGPE